jgi:glycosyltransferase involved in cell wall biosynthesis
MLLTNKKLSLVSIVMNCHNGEKYLAEALESILSQSYKNWELIFFDNASSDSSKDIFKSYNDNRFKYFYNKKKINLYHARNKAIQKTKGDFISFIDVDDWWETNNLTSRKEFFLNSSYAFSYSNCYYYFEKNKKKKLFNKQKLPDGYIFESLCKNYLVNLSTIMIRRSYLSKLAYYFDRKYNVIGDYDLVLRLSEKYLVHSINNPLVNIRYHDTNFSRLNRDLHYKEYKIWYKKIVNLDQYKNYQNIFLKKLKYLEIIKDVIKFKNLKILKKILNYPFCSNKVKLIVIFFTPRYFLNFLYK